jgi:hypothetical protein
MMGIMKKSFLLVLSFVVLNNTHAASKSKSVEVSQHKDEQQAFTVTLPPAFTRAVNVGQELVGSLNACRADATKLTTSTLQNLLGKMDATGAAVKEIVKENATQIHGHLDKTVQLFDVKTIIAH